MATPDIGTTISDGYSKGFDRLASHAASLAVPALVVGVVVAAITQLQVELVPGLDDVFGAALRGETIDIERGDRAMVNVLGALSTAVQVFFTYAGLALFGGAYHRARKAAAASASDVRADVPGPGALMPALVAAGTALLPKLAILVALTVAGSLAGIVSDGLGALVGFLAAVAVVYLTIRWVYASIVAGSGEATGDAAFERSASIVEGSWWGTLGVWLVVSLATFLPIAIVAGIAGAVVPTTFLSSLVTSVVMLMGTYSIYASAIESGWAQVEGSHERPAGGTDDGGGFAAPPSATPSPDAEAAPHPTPTPAPVSAPAPESRPPAGGDDRERGPFV